MNAIANQIADLEAQIAELKSRQAASASRGKVIEVRDIKARDRKSRGETYEGETKVGQHADIVKGKSIRLFGVETNRGAGPLSYDRTFKVGDVAVSGSYNLIYTDTITSIGAKSVSLGGKRLSIYEFNFYNNTMDLDKVAAHNAVESQCI